MELEEELQRIKSEEKSYDFWWRVLLVMIIITFLVLLGFIGLIIYVV